MRMKVLGRGFTVGLVVLAIAGCATTPTGRRQLKLMPDSQMNSMGLSSFEELKKTTPIEKDAAWNQYIRCIVNPLLAVSEDTTGASDWETVVFRDDSPNAFALPGGKIGVHTGMLKVAKTDAQLAAVLGHEIGHVTARHGNERVSQGLIAQGVMVAADAFSKNSPQKPVLMGLLGVGAQFGVLLPFSRSQESESDRIGLDLMSRAGFDPREAVTLWENMKAASGGKSPPEFMSTHPSNDSRIRKIQEQVPSVLKNFEAVQASGKAPRCERPKK